MRPKGLHVRRVEAVLINKLAASRNHQTILNAPELEWVAVAAETKKFLLRSANYAKTSRGKNSSCFDGNNKLVKQTL